MNTVISSLRARTDDLKSQRTAYVEEMSAKDWEDLLRVVLATNAPVFLRKQLNNLLVVSAELESLEAQHG